MAVQVESTMTDKEYVEAVIGQTCTDEEIRAFCAIWPNTAETRIKVLAVVAIPRIGTTCLYMDETYVILSTATYQENVSTPWNPDAEPSIVTICTILQVVIEGDQKGHDAGFPTKQVKSSEIQLVQA